MYILIDRLGDIGAVRDLLVVAIEFRTSRLEIFFPSQFAVLRVARPQVSRGEAGRPGGSEPSRSDKASVQRDFPTDISKLFDSRLGLHPARWLRKILT